MGHVSGSSVGPNGQVSYYQQPVGPHRYSPNSYRITGGHLDYSTSHRLLATAMSTDSQKNLEAILKSPSYLPADRDPELLQKPELRPVRLQLELYKPELALQEHHVRSTIVLF